jgi:L-gulono-1,4-lactone dehydrogenase
VSEVVTAVREAAGQGFTVRAVGSGHSSSAVAVAPDVLLDLGALQRVRFASTASGLVTVEAGLPLYRLSAWLWRAGLSLSNLGDIDRQTVAGAISTGTHGTGLAYGSLSEQVRGLELVLADGSVVWCSSSSRPELFDAARVGLGAFGVVTAVQLQCVPAFPLASSERPVPVPEALAAVTDPAHDHAEFFWFPHTSRALLKTSTRCAPGTALARRPALRRFVEDELLENAALDVVTGLASSRPVLIRPANRICTTLLPTRTQVDRSYRVFASRRRLVFRESEYAVPLPALPWVFAELGQWLRDHPIGFPLEVRNGPAESPWLSMAYGRPTAWISAQTHRRQPHEPLMRRLGEICASVGGRPHWGKIHFRDGEELAALYPRYDDVLRVRQEVDPERVFVNPYVASVLGL